MTGLAIAPNLTLPLELVTEPIGVLANRGRGKSYATHALVEEIHDAGVPVVVLDVKGDWWGLRSSADGKSDGLPFYIFGGDHADLPLEPTAGRLLADLVVDERVSVVLDLSGMSKTKARSFTVAFAEQLYHRNRDPLFVVVDEADVLIPQRATAETARLLGAMEDIAKRGRGRGIGMAVVTQRPQEVAKSVLDLMDTLVLLGMTGPRSLKSISEWISGHVDEDTTAADVMATLPSLPVGTAWVWSPMHGLLERIKVRTIRTFDSHPAPKPGETRRTPKTRATLDLTALGEQIAATVERAKADDPAELRKRIRELEQRLEDTPAVDVDGLQLALNAAADQNGYLQAFALLLIERLSGVVTDAEISLQEILTHKPPAEENKGSDRSRSDAPRPDNAPAPTHTRDGGSLGRSEASGSSNNGGRGGSPAGSDSLAGDPIHLKAGARRMLEVLARQRPLRITRAQLGTLAGFKITGGTFRTYWSTLTRAGLVEESGGEITITDAGLAQVGDVGGPISTEDLVEQYRSVLKSGAREMLDALFHIHPDGHTREQLAYEVGMEPTGGTFRTYLSTLRRNGLIEERNQRLYAADVLFMGAAS